MVEEGALKESVDGGGFSQGLKRKLDSWHKEGEADMERASVRIQHLRGHETAGDTPAAV